MSNVILNEKRIIIHLSFENKRRICRGFRSMREKCSANGRHRKMQRSAMHFRVHGILLKFKDDVQCNLWRGASVYL